MRRLIQKILLFLSMVSFISCDFFKLPSAKKSDFVIEYDDEIELGTTEYNKVESAYSIGTISKNFYHKNYTPCVGEVNLLCIPILFNDFGFTQKELNIAYDKIHATLFGKTEETSWESVSSYYEKSSFGNLIIKGKVSEAYNSDLSTSLFANQYKLYQDAALETLISEAYSWYQEQNPDDTNDYDLNDDGYLDGVYFVYLAPHYLYKDGKIEINKKIDDTIASTIYWAFTSWSSFSPNINNPVIGTYFWSSYYFIFEGYYNSGIDAHTFIHETGHMLSLSDYHSYTTLDKAGYNPYKPLGGADMMDYNVIDHNSYSKFALGWVKPYLIDKEGTLTIDIATTTGDCVLIPTSKYNNTSFDEYLMLELFAPVGLNEQDLTESLIPNSLYWSKKASGKELNNVGIRLYHVDARLVSFKTMTNSQGLFATNINYVSNINNIQSDTYLDFAHTNTPTGFKDKEITETYNLAYDVETKSGESERLIQAITPEGINYGESSIIFSNDGLFYKNQAFSFTNTTFNKQFPFGSYKKANNGDKFLFNFSITSMTKDKCTLSFTSASKK